MILTLVVVTPIPAMHVRDDHDKMHNIDCTESVYHNMNQRASYLSMNLFRSCQVHQWHYPQLAYMLGPDCSYRRWACLLGAGSRMGSLRHHFSRM